ncbi:MAG: hypothetical protein IPO81_15875 [Kouleothrix sp.]|nr:hypothetical protein [Kouleothrix sp.]
MQLADLYRNHLERAYRIVLPHQDSLPQSLIVDGLPQCGVEKVIQLLVDRIRSEWAAPARRIVVELNLSTCQLKPIAYLVQILIDSIGATGHISPPATSDRGNEWSSLLAHLREEVLTVAERNGQLIFILDDFDTMLKFKRDEAQDLLNTFQSIGYEQRYRTAFIIRCYRDIQDICRETNYSDFYKIFGTNHHRVSRVSDQMIEQFVKARIPNDDPEIYQRIVQLSAGYPEHAELLMRHVGVDENLERQALDDLTLVFDEWMSCLTPDEQHILRLLANNQTLDDQYIFIQRKLIRKALLQDSGVKIASPLLQRYLLDQVGKISGNQPPFIRRSSTLSKAHRYMLERLFQGRHYIEWKVLQNLTPDDATVYQISGEDSNGVPYRPCVVKVHLSSNIDTELERTSQARDMLGSIVPNLLGHANYENMKAIAFEYATGDNSGFKVHQFAEFYNSEPIENITTLLRRLFEQVLWPFYSRQSLKVVSVSSLYFLPRIRQGEYDRLADLFRRNPLYDRDIERQVIPGITRPLANPGIVLRPENNMPQSAHSRIFGERREVGLCRVHGDINPRNVLIDGIDHIHIIDFATMKDDGARFIDFTRAEAEIKFKLTEVEDTQDSFRAMVYVERLISEASSDEDFTFLAHLPFTANIAKMVASVAVIREAARRICQFPISASALEFEYKTALLAQTLRIALYDEYLSRSQQHLAITSAALLTERLLMLREMLEQK